MEKEAQGNNEGKARNGERQRKEKIIVPFSRESQ